MIDLILFATAWGPRFGGINSFNRDFGRALGLALGESGRVACVVCGEGPGDRDNA